MMQRKFALRGSNLSPVIEFTPLDELYNSTDDEETAREIEEEWHPDDDVRIRGNLVYTMPEVSAESRRGNTDGMNKLFFCGNRSL
jgi:hypothetical protein